MNGKLDRSASIFSALSSLWVNRNLIYQLTRREVIGRYRGSALGLAWSFFNPILLLTVYTFVFSVVFKARWGGDESSKADFAIVLFVGIMVHGIFAECINRAPGLILSNASYVKRVIFPLETLPWVALGSALFHASITLLVLVVAQYFIRHTVPWTIIYFPLVIAPLAFMTMGVAWVLAALGVYIRDIGQITGIFTTVLMFLSPVFYPVSALPEGMRKWIYLNPLVFMIETSRSVLIWGAPVDWYGLAKYYAGSLVVLAIGYWCFQKMRRGFADVL